MHAAAGGHPWKDFEDCEPGACDGVLVAMFMWVFSRSQRMDCPFYLPTPSLNSSPKSLALNRHHHKFQEGHAEGREQRWEIYY